MTDKKTLASKKRVAFVASGGAVKAACFHVGVCLALQEKGFSFSGGLKNSSFKSTPSNRPRIDIYVGSSAGALITTLLASGHSLSRIIKSFSKANKVSSAEKPLPKIGYLDIFHPAALHFINPFRRSKIHKRGWETIKGHLFLRGLFTTKGLEKYLRTKILPTLSFNELAPDLNIVATQLDYSQKTVFGKKKGYSEEHACLYTDDIAISDAVAASTSLPPFFTPYRLTHQNKETIHYFDGEIRQTLSTHVAKDSGADLIIASYTHQPYHYTPEIGSLMNQGISYITVQALYQCIEQKIATSKSIHDNKELVLSTVDRFFRDENLPSDKRKNLVLLLEEKMEYSRDLDYIFIHPQPDDYEMFFGDHFNLSAKVMDQAVRIGFKSAINALRKYSLES
ncbi:MAG: patatin-like phospholipase family protein [Deltaproteobacteria bacterium]|nr:patatin-like phospholipase family protein [Deltaproteobacteria bacterium]